MIRERLVITTVVSTQKMVKFYDCKWGSVIEKSNWKVFTRITIYVDLNENVLDELRINPNRETENK